MNNVYRYRINSRFVKISYLKISAVYINTKAARINV